MISTSLPFRWRAMLATNISLLIGVSIFRTTRPVYYPYIHLLVDYHFGFTKRALIGELVSLFLHKVPISLVFVISGSALIITAGLFIELFRRTFGFNEEHFPLFVLLTGSPFFLKNFAFSLGYFDVYGCLATIFLMLIPARSIAFVLTATVISLLLILIHHIHFLMYIPTIATIVLLRYYLAREFNRINIFVGIAAFLCVVTLFLAAQFLAIVSVPEEEFVGYLHSRLSNPAQVEALHFSYIWYRPFSSEIIDTWHRMPSNILGVPLFLFLILLHYPVWQYLSTSIRNLESESHRRWVIASIAAVSIAYLIIFLCVFDYSRWISNWAVCVFLILHAIKTLPSTQAPPLSSYGRKALVFGWIETAIPRVGIIEPYCFRLLTNVCS
jgi:hypothetical protein